ncbi:hypothetical protein PENNAL_c0268G05984 [Penicillium nalgiovense]|uniref:Uncharacterized protein n=1 Tax=Penicillium nalgiovense TaxID=60175 RepID=A0A1V6WHF4_PENNA|nr:hypothetical protein PENNAL_c0268G05984 [Penicillium nalgiovense]
MSSLQLTELIYCTALVWIPKAKARISTSQKLETSILPDELFVQTFVLHNTNTTTALHAIVHRSSPSPHVEHPCGESHCRIGDKSKVAALRRMLHRIFCPRYHRLNTMDGGVYEPLALAVRIAKSYPITTVQFIITGGFITRLWLSEVAQCTQRGFFEETA